MTQGIRRAGAGLMVSLLLICAGVTAYQETNGPDQNISFAGKEIGLPSEPVLPEIPKIPDSFYQHPGAEAFVNGTGNLTRLVEVNNTAGEYAYGLLQVVGTDETSWSYRTASDNATGECYVIGEITVGNADKVIFEGHAIAADQQVAYAGVGFDGAEKEDGSYSGNVQFLTAVTQNNSWAVINTEKEQGTITHLTRAYHVIGSNSTEAEAPHMPPGLESTQSEDEAMPGQNFFYDQYAGSFMYMKQGTMNEYQSYALSGPKGASSVQDQDSGESRILILNTMGEEWPVDHLSHAGRGSYEELQAVNGTSIRHSGYSQFFNGNSTTFGQSEASADSYLKYRIMPYGSKETSPWNAGYSDAVMKGGPVKRDDSGRVTIPVSFSGWGEGTVRDGVYTNAENYIAKGASVSRNSDAGVYPNSNEPETGVLANITAGNEMTAKGASGLNGMSVLSVDINDANATTLNGRWIVTSPEGTPITRWVQAVMPGNSAYSTSSTLTGMKNFKDSAYYRSGMVDVS